MRLLTNATHDDLELMELPALLASHGYGCWCGHQLKFLSGESIAGPELLACGRTCKCQFAHLSPRPAQVIGPNWCSAQ